MQKDTKKIELMYGEAKIIATKARTTTGYVRNVLYRHRLGQNIYGTTAKRVIKAYQKLKT